jgi:hypothetical protein
MSGDLKKEKIQTITKIIPYSRWLMQAQGDL